MTIEPMFEVKFWLYAGYPLDGPCRLSIALRARNETTAIGKAYGRLHRAGIDPELLREPNSVKIEPEETS